MLEISIPPRVVLELDYLLLAKHLLPAQQEDPQTSPIDDLHLVH